MVQCDKCEEQIAQKDMEQHNNDKGIQHLQVMLTQTIRKKFLEVLKLQSKSLMMLFLNLTKALIVYSIPCEKAVPVISLHNNYSHFDGCTILQCSNCW